MTRNLPAQGAPPQDSSRPTTSGQWHDAGPSGQWHDAGPPAQRPSPGKIFADPRTGPAPWALALAVFGAVMGTSLGLGGVLEDFSWWPRAAVVVAGTLLIPALLRRYPALGPFAPLGALAGWFMSMTLVFFPDTALLRFIPTAGTARAALEMASDASGLIMSSTTPVPSAIPLFFLFCAGLGFVALLIDTVAITVSMPAASALGLLLIMLPPALTTSTGIGTLGFIGAGAGFLLILGCCRWYAPEGKLRTGTAVFASGTLSRGAALGAAVVLLTASIPAVIPGFTEGAFPQGSRINDSGGGIRLDPMISLGNDLRSQSNQVNLSYLSNTEGPQYLRLNTLEDFTGQAWQPSELPDGLGPELTGLSPASGPFPSVPQTETLTWISIAALRSDWLPAPLSATSVESLSGRWLWNPSTQTFKGRNASTRDQSYVVRSEMPVLSQDVLAAATSNSSDVDPIYSELPNDVPALVQSTAQDVAGAAATPYAKAMAIQDYLRSAEFSYSLSTPAAEGYDGSGMDVLEAFLEEKSGYCVHYSAAMAVMAREVGVPSRIAIGFAPGSRTTEVGELDGLEMRGYEATGRDAHAWPELYFEGLGWVPFEPTPSRGDVPDYAEEDLDSAPVPEDLAAPSAAASATATPTVTASTAAADSPAGSSGAGAGPWLRATVAVVLVLVLLAIPALARIYVRRRRLAQVRGAGSSGAGWPAPEAVAWRELLATAVDFGYNHDPALTPALQAENIARMLGTSARAGLALVLHSYEQLAYGQFDAVAAGRDDLADAVETVAARLYTRATPGQRLRARLVPASFFHRP